MHVAHGWQKRFLPLSATRYYRPEEVLALFRGSTGPHWLMVGGQSIRFDWQSEAGVLAAHAVAAYHNDLCEPLAPDLAWARDTERAEQEAREYMEAESSDDEAYVTSEEDIDYSALAGQQFFYQ